MMSMMRTHVLVLIAASMMVGKPAMADERPRHRKAKAKAATAARSATPPLRARTRALTLDGSVDRISEPLISELRTELSTIWSGRTLRRGITAVYVVWADTGEEVYAAHADEPLNPASNVKLVSTASALTTLGTRWRYVTRLLGPATTATGTIPGDVYLLGKGDPTLRAMHLSRMAENLASRGVTRIAGDVIVGEKELRDAVGTARVDLHVRGLAAGAAPEITVEPPLPAAVVIDNQATTVKRGRTRIRLHREFVDADQRRVITVTGRIREGDTAKLRRWLGHRDVYTVRFLAAALEAAGIEVAGVTRREAWPAYVARMTAAGHLPIELARHQSRPLAHIVARINKPSNNYLADRLIMTAGGVVAGTDPSMDAGVALMDLWLSRAGIDPDAVILDTGSGLSYETQISARNIVRVLRVAAGYAAPDEPGALSAFAITRAESFRRSLAVAGIDGTLGYRFQHSDVQGQMIGKTGTLTGIIALSGFVTAQNGRTLCFSIVTNGGRHRRRRHIRRAQADMVKAMHHYLTAQHAQLAAAAAP